ncbi:hypothetical protein DRN75_01575 [Nanoarchaeota archaeon]|nr:MAG: hypothetical protein DRN75_01575 [Nanoarchaeota archaeon]
MALQLKKLSEVYGMKVYTDAGNYFGDIEEAEITGNAISKWRIKSTKNSFLNKVMGGVKGVAVPHKLVRAIGEIMIISEVDIASPEEVE